MQTISSNPGSPSRKRLFLYFLLFAGAQFLLDQAIKYWTRSNLAVGQTWDGGPWPGVFELTLSYNKGIAFGLFQGLAVLMTPFALLITGVICWNVWFAPKMTPFIATFMALLVGGSIGNLYDRLVDKNGVTDMFFVRLGNITQNWPINIPDFPVFNWADTCITCGILGLAFTWMREDTKPKESKPVDASVSQTEHV